MREGLAAPGDVHVERIAGDVSYDPDQSAVHWAFGRPVEWLTGPAGVSRHSLPLSLQVSLQGSVSGGRR